MNKKIFILHGWAHDVKKWDPFIKIIKKYDLNPVILKIPGLTENIDRPWNIDDYVKWLNKKLESEKNIILVGHSNGGKIALSYSLKYPDKINKLFLLDSSGIYHNDLKIKLKRILFRNIAKIGKKITKSILLKNILYKIAGESDYNQSSETMKITMQNLINLDLTPILTKLKIPTVIIWGKDDSVTPVSDAYIFNKNIKYSKLFLINGARHSPQFTHSSEVSKIIYEHI